MRIHTVIDKGRALGIAQMWERLTDLELICRKCTPSLFRRYSIGSILDRLKGLKWDCAVDPHFYFDLSTWTNVAWRHLGRSNVSELEDDSTWIAILERLQGAEVALSLTYSGTVYSGRILAHMHNSLKVFGRALVIEAVGNRDFIDEHIEVDFNRSDLIQNASVVIRALNTVDRITISRDPFLCEMVSAVGFDAISSEEDIQNVEKKLTDAIEIIGNDNENSQLVREFVTTIVPLENPKRDEHQSLSIQATPGTIYIGKNCKLPVFAEALVHEADHQRLYEIQRCERLVKEGSTEIYYSPWRMDPRPAIGLLLGASAFLRVSYFWYRLVASEHAEVDRETAGYRSLFTAAQSLEALETVLRSSELTDFGREYCNTLWRDAQVIWQILQDAPRFKAWSIQGAREMNAHKCAWTAKNHLQVNEQR